MNSTTINTCIATQSIRTTAKCTVRRCGERVTNAELAAVEAAETTLRQFINHFQSIMFTELLMLLVCAID